VPLVAGEIAQDLARYLLDSEQTPSAVLLGVHVVPAGRVGHAGGLMVQLLPGVSDEQADELSARVRELGAVTSQMAAGAGPMAWVESLFAGDLTILGESPVRFHCGCSVSRVETALMLLGAGEVRSMIEATPDGPTVLSCGFCRKEYAVSAATLRRVLRSVEAGEAGDRPS